MKYLCTACQYIYDEDSGDSEEGIKAGTKFDNLGDSFVCPVCGELPDVFHEIKEEINYLGDIAKDSLEQEHFINILNKSNQESEIKIGFQDLHASGDEHRITSIGIYDEYGDLIYEEFFQSGEDPIMNFDISDFDEFEIRIRCSIHGLWGKKFTINI